MEEIIEQYNLYLNKVPKGSMYIAERLREDNLHEALTAIKDFSEGVIWLSQATQLFKQNGVHADLDIEKIWEFLLNINDGLEKQDYILVADMFEYEITEFFNDAPLARGLIL